MTQSDYFVSRAVTGVIICDVPDVIFLTVVHHYGIINIATNGQMIVLNVLTPAKYGTLSFIDV